VAVAFGTGPQLVHDVAQSVHHLEVRALVVAADVVGAPGLTPAYNEIEGPTVILDVEPVADVGALAVNRKLFAGDRVEDHQRDQLFRKLVRAVVVGTVGEGHRQVVGAVPRAHQVIGRRFRGRVGARGIVGSDLRKEPIGTEGTEDFVGADVVETDVVSVPPGGARRFEEVGGTADIGVDEIDGTVDRAIDVALGGEVNHGVDVVSREEPVYGIDIANIGVNKGVAGAVGLGDATKARKVASVGQSVDVDELQLRVAGKG
jgi:hypothetical protein